jgi:hypothetical protein
MDDSYFIIINLILFRLFIFIFLASQISRLLQVFCAMILVLYTLTNVEFQQKFSLLSTYSVIQMNFKNIKNKVSLVQLMEKKTPP